MIEVRITLDEIDYDSLAEYLVPYVAENLEKKGGVAGFLGRKPGAMKVMARQALKAMSQQKKDECVLKLLQDHKGKAIRELNGLIKKKVSGVKIADVAAYRLPDEK